MAGFMQGLGRFANAANTLLFPGLGGAGVDPQVAQQLRAQAMMQAGLGIASGQNLGMALHSGYETGRAGLGDYLRVQEMGERKQDRAENRAYRDWSMKRAEEGDAYRKERDIVGDEQWQKQFEANERRIAELEKDRDSNRALTAAQIASLNEERAARIADRKLLLAERERLRKSLYGEVTGKGARTPGLLERLRTTPQTLEGGMPNPDYNALLTELAVITGKTGYMPRASNGLGGLGGMPLPGLDPEYD